MNNQIFYHFDNIDEVLIPKGFESWLDSMSKSHCLSFSLKYIFCSDTKILDINKSYLKHNYYTDIITFDLSDSPTQLNADIFISIDRVLDNSSSEGVSFASELARVMSHGVFHLLGFSDKTKQDQLKMRELENKAISKIL